MRKSAVSIAFAAVVALLSACSNEGGRYLAVVGGGFAFNYRIAEATVDVILVAAREPPAGASVEVTFENPAGGAPIVMKKDAPPRAVRVTFTTPPLSGIVADKEYAMDIRLVAADGSEIERIDKSFHSQLDQSALPPMPLTIGPGYVPNPNLPADLRPQKL